IEKRLHRSQICIARDNRKATNSVGATSNRETTFDVAPSRADHLLLYHCYKDLTPTEPTVASAEIPHKRIAFLNNLLGLAPGGRGTRLKSLSPEMLRGKRFAP